jgi:uncharacterized hydrophobic protein (TIGR00341 family)
MRIAGDERKPSVFPCWFWLSMALRLLQMRLDPETNYEPDVLLDGLDILIQWVECDEQGTTGYVLVRSEDAETLVSTLTDHFAHLEGFRIVLLPVEATLPRPPDKEEEAAKQAGGETNGGDEETGEEKDESPPINIEELYSSVTEGVDVSWTYALTVALSAIVACVGVYRDVAALTIGSMILAPLLGANMALCLGTTLGDFSLIRRSLKVNGLGIAVALATSIAFGLLVGVDLSARELSSRTTIGALEFIVAGAAGAAGALSVTKRTVSGVVGVMIAIALLPPLVILGMLLGAGEWTLALHAGILTAANYICVNLAGSVVLWWQRIRPRRAYKQKKARRALITAVAIWIGLLVLLVGLTYLAP